MWSWFGRQELTEAVSLLSPWFCCCCKARPSRAGLAVALGCAVLHQRGIRQNFIYVLFTHNSFVLKPNICMYFPYPCHASSSESFHLVTAIWYCTCSARPCSPSGLVWGCFFWFHLSFFFSSSNTLLCSSLGWGSWVEWASVLQRKVWASSQRKTTLHEVADHFPYTQSGPGDWRKNMCVISLQLTTGMSSLPPVTWFGCHHQMSPPDLSVEHSRSGRHILMYCFRF